MKMRQGGEPQGRIIAILIHYKKCRLYFPFRAAGVLQSRLK